GRGSTGRRRRQEVIPRGPTPRRACHFGLPNPEVRRPAPNREVWLIPNLGIRMPKMGIKLKTPGSRAAKSVIVPSSVSLADALFSQTQQRLFALLFGKPE